MSYVFACAVTTGRGVHEDLKNVMTLLVSMFIILYNIASTQFLKQEILFSKKMNRMFSIKKN